MAWVLFLALVVSALDFLSIGGLLPLLTNAFGTGGAGTSLNRFGGDALARLSTTTLAALLLALFVVKAIVTSYSFREGFRFTYDVQVSIATRMLRGLFGRDYEYFLSQNSAVLLKNLTAEVQYFAGSVVLSVFYVVTQGLVIVTIGVLLALVSPGVALVSFVLVGGMTAATYALVSRRLTEWGKLREARLADLNRIAHEALTGIKMVKATSAEAAYLERFESAGHQYARLNTRYQSTGAIPPVMIELLLFGGATATVFFFAASGRSLTAIIPMIGLLGAAAYRLLPAAKNLFAYLVNIRYYGTTIHLLEETLRGTDAAVRAWAPPRGSLAPLTNNIRLEDIEYRYPDAAREAIAGVTLDIPAGSHLAIVGGSGSGKTTLIDVLLGLLHPARGRVRIDGVELTIDNVGAWRAQIGYVSQHIFLADATLRENVAFGQASDAIDDRRVDEVLRQTHLSDLVARLPLGVNTEIGENGSRLSGGERQRLGIARALYRSPRVLVLDEATSALDTITERSVNADVLRACEDITVIIIAHRLSTVRQCDRLVLMRHGAIAAAGTYDELLVRSPEFAEMHEPKTVEAAPGS